MNRILFFRHEIDAFINSSSDAIEHNDSIVFEIPSHDFRMQHIRNILRAQNDDVLRAGIVNESVGELHVRDMSEARYQICYHVHNDISSHSSPHSSHKEPSFAVHLILAHTRPPVMARLLRDLSSMRVNSINVHLSALTEKSYINASFWKKKDMLILEGMMQGDTIHQPTVMTEYSLKSMLQKVYGLLDHNAHMIKLYCHRECELPLTDVMQNLVLAHENITDVLLAIGPERGYTDEEIELLQQERFKGFHLGSQILRSEVAAHISVGLLDLLR